MPGSGTLKMTLTPVRVAPAATTMGAKVPGASEFDSVAPLANSSGPGRIRGGVEKPPSRISSTYIAYCAPGVNPVKRYVPTTGLTAGSVASVKSPDSAETASRNGLATLRAMTLTPESRVVPFELRMLPLKLALPAKYPADGYSREIDVVSSSARLSEP